MLEQSRPTLYLTNRIYKFRPFRKTLKTVVGRKVTTILKIPTAKIVKTLRFRGSVRECVSTWSSWTGTESHTYNCNGLSGREAFGGAKARVVTERMPTVLKNAPRTLDSTCLYCIMLLPAVFNMYDITVSRCRADGTGKIKIRFHEADRRKTLSNRIHKRERLGNSGTTNAHFRILFALHRFRV